jgi:hypothetical protein
MNDDKLELKQIQLEQQRLKIETKRLEAAKAQHGHERLAQEAKEQEQNLQATFDRR